VTAPCRGDQNGPGGGGEAPATVDAVSVTKGCAAVLVGVSGLVEEAWRCCGGLLVDSCVTCHEVFSGYRKQQEGSVSDLSQYC